MIADLTDGEVLKIILEQQKLNVELQQQSQQQQQQPGKPAPEPITPSARDQQIKEILADLANPVEAAKRWLRPGKGKK